MISLFNENKGYDVVKAKSDISISFVSVAPLLTKFAETIDLKQFTAKEIYAYESNTKEISYFRSRFNSLAIGGKFQEIRQPCQDHADIEEVS